jgi:FlaA1/EpsC-like NDP-sugar epimerase
MRYVYRNYNRAVNKGKIARKDVTRNHSYSAVASRIAVVLQNFKSHTSRKHRVLKPADLFLNIYPLYFPEKENHDDLEQLDHEFSKESIKSIAVYGAGEGAKLVFWWITQFNTIENIVFLDRNKQTSTFLNRNVFFYQEFDFSSVDLVIIGTIPEFVPEILENLKKVSSVPIYLFGP